MSLINTKSLASFPVALNKRGSANLHPHFTDNPHPPAVPPTHFSGKQSPNSRSLALL
jgi:hypothetical protein